jgi:hypothetical protein
MTKLYLIHREEQVDAARREFRRYWRPFAAQHRKTVSAKVLAGLEWATWREFVREKLGTAQNR